jgi:hypothetical protein
MGRNFKKKPESTITERAGTIQLLQGGQHLIRLQRLVASIHLMFMLIIIRLGMLILMGCGLLMLMVTLLQMIRMT